MGGFVSFEGEELTDDDMNTASVGGQDVVLHSVSISAKCQENSGMRTYVTKFACNIQLGLDVLQNARACRSSEREKQASNRDCRRGLTTASTDCECCDRFNARTRPCRLNCSVHPRSVPWSGRRGKVLTISQFQTQFDRIDDLHRRETRFQLDESPCSGTFLPCRRIWIHLDGTIVLEYHAARCALRHEPPSTDCLDNQVVGPAPSCVCCRTIRESNQRTFHIVAERLHSLDTEDRDARCDALQDGVLQRVRNLD